jgi:hypothetical protein
VDLKITPTYSSCCFLLVCSLRRVLDLLNTLNDWLTILDMRLFYLALKTLGQDGELMVAYVKRSGRLAISSNRSDQSALVCLACRRLRRSAGRCLQER